jgi:23S rRNA pseudouridine1911/1915/1917 synthase
MAKQPILDILYDDPEFVIVNKAPGMLSIPDRFVATMPSVLKALHPLYEQVLVVHRLDRETSGIICFAKTEEAHKSLNKQFQERTVDKYYYAIVEGTPYPTSGEIDLPIIESQTTPGKMITKKSGKPSLTLYETLEVFKHYAHVKANIKTGRMHQVRVHFNAIGHPLAIDPLYGRRSEIFLSQIKRKKFNMQKEVEELPLMSRTTLHAHSLSFDHPVTGERMTFEAEPPKDFRALLSQLRKWGG